MAATWDPSNKDSSITLSNGNLTATGTASSAWRSVIATGSGVTSGKVYWRIKCSFITGSYAAAGISTNTEPTNTLIGSDANGWLAYTQPNIGPGSIYHNGGNMSTAQVPNFSTIGDYIVVAYDATNGHIWFTTQTAAGVLSTNWNAGNGNPSTGAGGTLGGISVTAGTALQPAASVLDLSGAGDAVILDTTSTIVDSTLTGFSPFDTTPPVLEFGTQQQIYRLQYPLWR